MFKEAIYHESDSSYAYPINEETLAVKLRTKKGDLDKAVLCYGDRYDPDTNMKFYEKEMKVTYRDEFFDYYETEITPGFNRISYYFKLTDKESTEIMALDRFYDKPVTERNRNYMFSYICRGDLFEKASWLEDSIFYLIFTDRFNKEDIDDGWLRKPTHEDIFGGNIKGITDKVDYLYDMGINCIYLTPIFKSESNHKYDVIDYYEIDENFGDKESFKRLVDKCHSLGIKVVLDAVFNHTSHKFFAFRDIIEKKDSYYKDWYFFKNDIDYETFGSVKSMPKLNTSNLSAKEYLLNVAEYWIREFDIDGWRLDVANEVDHKFWREFRERIKKVKSSAFIVGEAWDGAESYLKGDQFDSAMNYPFMYIMTDYFAKKKIDTFKFDYLVNSLFVRYKKYIRTILLNLLDSHDTSRFLFECGEDIEKLKLAVFFQMTCIGMPMILYGDEAGLSGGHEPDSRRAMNFNEIDSDLHNFYKKMIKIRKENNVLKRGEFKSVLVKEDIYAYSRYIDDDKIVCVFNNSDRESELSLPLDCKNAHDIYNNNKYTVQDGRIVLKTIPYGKYILKLEK